MSLSKSSRGGKSLTYSCRISRRIIGEESYSAGQEKRFLLDDVSSQAHESGSVEMGEADSEPFSFSQAPTWIIDPLDGVSLRFHSRISRWTRIYTFCRIENESDENES